MAKIFFPNNLTENSRSNASQNIAIIGPKIIALGEIDFISAQTTPERQISPFSFHK